MASYSRTRRINHPAATMLEVIARLEDWPSILDEIRSVTIVERSGDTRHERVVADLAVAFAVMRSSFRLTAHVDRARYRFEALSEERPFKRLAITWQLEPKGLYYCRSVFEAEVQLSNPLLAAAVNAVGVETLFRQGTAAFVRRADALAGRSDGDLRAELDDTP